MRGHRARIVLWAEGKVPRYFKPWGWTSCPRSTGHTDKQGSPREWDLHPTDAATLQELLSNGKKETKASHMARDDLSIQFLRQRQQSECFLHC